MALETTTGNIQNAAPHNSDDNDSLVRRLLSVIGATQRNGTIADGKSPQHLTACGKSLSKKIHGREIARLYAGKVNREAGESLHPYELQECCLHFAHVKLLNDLKENHKQRYHNLLDIAAVEGEPVERLLRVIGFEIRNIVFAKRNMSLQSGEVHAEQPVN